MVLFFFLTNSLTLFAQKDWAPVGAKWNFNQPSTELDNFVVFESKKDSVIQGESVRVIEVKLNGTSLLSREYMRQSKDSIFYFNVNTHKFYLLYNFNAKAGDTIVVHKDKFKPTKAFFSNNDSIDFFKYKVIAIDSIQISDEWFKRQKVEDLGNNSWGFTKPTGGGNDYILEKIGSITYFFGVFPGIVPEENLSLLRCYNEVGLEYKDPLWTQECGIISGINYPQSINDLQVYPDPFDEQLYINTSEKIETVEVYNLNGQEILLSEDKNGVLCLDTSRLKQGVYLLRITTLQHIYTRKIIKK